MPSLWIDRLWIWVRCDKLTATPSANTRYAELVDLDGMGHKTFGSCFYSEDGSWSDETSVWSLADTRVTAPMAAAVAAFAAEFGALVLSAGEHSSSYPLVSSLEGAASALASYAEWDAAVVLEDLSSVPSTYQIG